MPNTSGQALSPDGPHPLVRSLPLQPGLQELSSRQSGFSLERRRSSPSFVCAREPSWGGGRRGRSLSICLPLLCPDRSKCGGGGGGIPRVSAGSQGAPRFQSRAGRGARGGDSGDSGDAERVGPILLAGRLGLAVPLPPRRLHRRAPRRREGRRARINSGGGSASSGGAGSAGRVQRPVLPARPQDFAMGWGPRGLRAAGRGQRQRRPHQD